ncbi:MAG TPA: hypothetical protein VGV14_01855 [Rhodanobacter sp.]|nr:hypothetical protein [Rhodanobacter sp.]
MALRKAMQAREAARASLRMEQMPDADMAAVNELRAQYQSFSQGAVSSVTVPFERLRSLDTRYVPAADFGGMLLTVLRAGLPAGPLLRDECINRFMTANYPGAEGMVTVTLVDPGGLQPTATELHFSFNGYDIPSADGYLHLREMNEAAGSPMDGIAGAVMAEADAKGEVASLLIGIPQVVAELGPTADSIKAKPEDYALMEVQQLLDNVRQLHQRGTETDAGAAASELQGQVALLVPVQTKLEEALAAVQAVMSAHPCQTIDESTKQVNDQFIKDCADGHWGACAMLPSPMPSTPSGGMMPMGGGGLPTPVDNMLFNLLTGGAGTDMDRACVDFRTGRVSLTGKVDLTNHALFKAGVAIGLSVAASFVGGWLGGIGGRLIFGARTVGAAITATSTAGAFGGLGMVAGQDAYSWTARTLSDDRFVRQYMRMHSSGDYFAAMGMGAALGVPMGMLHYYGGAPVPGTAPGAAPGAAPGTATTPTLLYDANGQPMLVLNGEVLPPTPGNAPVTLSTPQGLVRIQNGQVLPVTNPAPQLILPGQGLPALADLPASTLQSAQSGGVQLLNAAGQPISVGAGANPSLSLPTVTSLLGESRLVGPTGDPLGGAVPAPDPVLLDAAGHPIGSAAQGPVVVDLQAGTPAFLRQITSQLPGSRGMGVEPGNWLLAYQGIYPTNAADLQMAQMIARNSPVWPNTPAWQTPISGMPQSLPWEIDPATHLFPQQGSVTMLPDPANPYLGQSFFPALGRDSRLVPFGLSDVNGFQTGGTSGLTGVADRVYLRRTFGLGLANAEESALMGQQINSMLKPNANAFVEIRPTRATDFSTGPSQQYPNAVDQVAAIAEQMPGARVERVTSAQIRRFAETGNYPPNSTSIQQEMIRDAAADTAGLGAGQFRTVVRIYRP